MLIVGRNNKEQTMISANTLFHFTSDKKNIENILTNKFSPRYCLEHLDFISDDTSFDIALPMVCFCDIPLSQIKNHISTYGEYAIGLSKDWGLRNGLSPVLYLHNNSQTKKLIHRLYRNTARLDNIKLAFKIEISEFASLDLVELMDYCKIYKGKMWRKGKLEEDILFYNEREWRYVPNLHELEDQKLKLLLNKDDFDNEEKRFKFNNMLKSFSVDFDAADIKYIIISKERERKEMIEIISQNEFGSDVLKVLTSKILTVEQINDDI